MSVLETAIGWLAPAECLNCGTEGSSFCEACSSLMIKPFGQRCWRCNALSENSRTCAACRRTGSPSHVWIAANHAGPARDLLSLYKFGHQRAAAESITRLMAAAFRAENPRGYVVIPVPTASSRVRERGFGHAELLSKKIALEIRTEQTSALRRLGQARQLGSKREDRLKQLASSFAVKNPKSIAGRRILLIDDVVTTGGTLIAAARVLRAAGAKSVDALLFAKHL